jgi:hypothetical protein
VISSSAVLSAINSRTEFEPMSTIATVVTGG